MTHPPQNLSLFPEPIDGPAGDPFFFEGVARQKGFRLIAGVDEAGRGPLAGPVVAAAVILRQGCVLEGVRDSKQMSPESREKAFPVILEQAVSAGIGVVSHRYVDTHNILKAALEAMRRAVLNLAPKPDFLLVDGTQGIPVSIPQQCLKKGDRISRSISAASVLAKVYRDRIMDSWHAMFPAYGFDRNKGYGTARHLATLRLLGPSPIHRLTFRGVSPVDQGED